MGGDEEGTLAQLKAHRKEVVDPKIAEHRGRIVKTTGDGLLAEFASAVHAARCAVEIQRLMRDRNAAVPSNSRVEFRIGVNVGDVVIDGGDIFGDGVNIAARLEGLADPGVSAFPAASRRTLSASLMLHSRIKATSSLRILHGQYGPIACGLKILPLLQHRRSRCLISPP
jgi:class 3 adenylate cyclase